jgi:hypothetical protein
LLSDCEGGLSVCCDAQGPVVSKRPSSLMWH